MHNASNGSCKAALTHMEIMESLAHAVTLSRRPRTSHLSPLRPLSAIRNTRAMACKGERVWKSGAQAT
eukprot:2635856-Prymnesium_polylepis.1